jgi:phosphonate transport system permease protein
MNASRAANSPYRLPPRLFDARCRACWATLAAFVLVVASFVSLDLRWRQFLSLEALGSMGRFVAEFFPPDLQPGFLRKVALGGLGNAGDVGGRHAAGRVRRPRAGTAGESAAPG